MVQEKSSLFFTISGVAITHTQLKGLGHEMNIFKASKINDAMRLHANSF
jgi:hypothetical protein